MIPLRDDNPVRATPVITIGLIALCVLVFLWQLSLSPSAAEVAVYQYGFLPGALVGRVQVEGAVVPPALTVFSSMFLHGSFLHVAGNMLYLWIFGDNIEDRLGRGRFIAFYLICGAIAALAQALPNMDSQTPMIGASGAISGVLGAYIVLYPRANVLVALPLLIIFYTFRVPALLVLGFWFLGQLMSSVAATGEEGGIAFGAHVGGFLAGLILIRFFLRERRAPRAH
jgi:membrane associated rhomboid family serine protease